MFVRSEKLFRFRNELRKPSTAKMLPLELLKVIFGALSRNDLDALMLTNVLFRDMILRDFAMEPLRYFAGLNIDSRQGCRFEITWGNDYFCEDIVEFSRRMRLGRVGELRLCPFFDENVLKVLLPVKDAWRDGQILTPWRFPSQSLCERAFSELFFCKNMTVVNGADEQLSHPLLSLPAVLECTTLRVLRPSNLLAVAKILEWLSVDAHSKESKRLTIYAEDVGDSVENLVQQLKTHFVESTRARGYVVIIYANAQDGQSQRFVNNETSEVLTIRHGTDEFEAYYIEVARKSMDEK